MNKKRNAVIYAKTNYWRANHWGTISLNKQIKLIKDQLSKHNIKIEKIYTDDHVVGSPWNAPGLKELVKDINDGKIDTVYILNFEILSGRNSQIIIDLYSNILEKNDTDLVAVLNNSGIFNKFISLKDHIEEIRIMDEYNIEMFRKKIKQDKEKLIQRIRK